MLGIELQRQSDLPLRRQIYQALRDQIINGKLREHEILPSTRELAKGLNVSRNTICEAYDMLIAEGFVTSSQGAPTRVSEGIHMESASESVFQSEVRPVGSIVADFRTGRPDLRQFPRFLWQQMMKKASDEITIDQYGYTGAQGLLELRKQITAWLFRNRGLTVDSQDIFITAGATHALHLIAELLCEDKKKIFIEDPCHTGMLQAFLNRGCSIVPIPVDEQGIQTSELLKRLENSKNVKSICNTDGVNDIGGIYVTPSHQFPLGGILSASRRASLIRFAIDHKAYIIEDDYDSEFRYCGDPIAPIYAMEPQQVIYVGTFSKSVFPALRIGFVILPKKLQKRWIHLRTYTDVQNPIFEQAALAMFLQTRRMDRHVQKMRRIYGERRRVLLDALKEEFGDEWRAYGDNAGLHLAIEFPNYEFDDTFRKSCLEEGINIIPVEAHCIVKNRHSNKLLIGYGHLEPKEIRNGIKRLKRRLL